MKSDIRESIVNAVCHRDYFDKGSNVFVEVFDNRVEISNPGGLPGGLNPADFGTKSVTRNRILAALLQRIHFIEKAGTGISRIREAVEKNGKSTVEFSYDGYFKVTFHRSIPGDEGLNEGLSEGLTAIKDGSQKASEKMSEKMSEKTKNVGENAQKVSEKIFSLIKHNPLITISELSQQTDVTTRTVERNIKKLQLAGRLNRIGPDKGGHWEVIEKNEE